MVLYFSHQHEAIRRNPGSPLHTTSPILILLFGLVTFDISTPVLGANQNNLTICIRTWNVAGYTPPDLLQQTTPSDEKSKDLKKWLKFEDFEKKGEPDIYAVGLQEIFELKFMKGVSLTNLDSIKKLFKTKYQSSDTKAKIWGCAIKTIVNSLYGQNDEYYIVGLERSFATMIVVLAKKSLSSQITSVMAHQVNTGVCVGSIYDDVNCRKRLPNKGAVGIRFNLTNTGISGQGETSFCFIAAHFNAGENKTARRFIDYKIIKEDIFKPFLLHHDNIFWFGDLNYRICMEAEEYRKLSPTNKETEIEDWTAEKIKEKLNYPYKSENEKLIEIFKRDELYNIMKTVNDTESLDEEGLFYGFKEIDNIPLLYAPTYKYIPGDKLCKFKDDGVCDKDIVYTRDGDNVKEKLHPNHNSSEGIGDHSQSGNESENNDNYFIRICKAPLGDLTMGKKKTEDKEPVLSKVQIDVKKKIEVRAPAWCDRVLYKSKFNNVLRVNDFQVGSTYDSDHKPVATDFDISFNDNLSTNDLEKDIKKLVDSNAKKSIGKKIQGWFRRMIFGGKEIRYCLDEREELSLNKSDKDKKKV